MTDQNAVATANVHAAIAMLLDGGWLENGLIASGGDVLDVDQRLHLARCANGAGADVVHFEHALDDEGRYGLAGIVVVAPRDDGCHVKTGCTLWIDERGGDAMILPPEGHRGAFRLLPDEVLFVDRRPQDAAEGTARAMAELARLAATAAADGARPTTIH